MFRCSRSLLVLAAAAGCTRPPPTDAAPASPADGEAAPPTAQSAPEAPECQDSLAAATEQALGELKPAGAEVQVRDLRTNETLVAISRGIDAPHPPASTVKPFISLAALDTGVVEPNEAIPCGGSWTRDDLHGVCFHAHRPQTAESALATSCNAYALDLAWRLGPERLAGIFDGAGLPGAAHATRRAKGGEFLATGLGHGGAVADAGSLADAYTGLVRSGSAHLPTVMAGMRRTYADPDGSAYELEVDGISLAGKTGTAEGDQDGLRHGWLVTLAPAGDPQLLVVAHMDGPGTGATMAGPVVTRVVEAWARDCRPDGAESR